ncbi:MAG: hypothetical protein ACYSYU_05305 [Planctomycetota bacterium]
MRRPADAQQMPRGLTRSEAESLMSFQKSLLLRSSLCYERQAVGV